MGYDRQIAGALRSIAAKGQRCKWHKPAAADPGADSWRDVRSGDPAGPHSISIAWFPPGLEAQRYLMNTPEGVPVGFEQGYMGAVEFEPLIGEKVEKLNSDGTSTGIFVTVFKIDKLAPDGSAILHTLWVKR